MCRKVTRMVRDKDDMSPYIKGDYIELQNEKMKLDEFANWAALISGVEEIIDCAERLGINTDKSDSWIKPLPLERYVREKGNQIYNDIMHLYRGV